MEPVKIDALQKIITNLESAVVAFSGGVDSTLLLSLCVQHLGNKQVLAATADSPTLPRSELTETKELVKKINVQHVIIPTEEMKNECFTSNPPDRCYYCKQELFIQLQNLADKYGFKHMVYGATHEDLKDYRPGISAGEKAGARAPLLEAGISKKEVRELSHHLGLSTAEKPSSACLASRIPYGTRITKDNLSQVEQAEDLLKYKFNLPQVRVRHHGDIARIEAPPENFSSIFLNNCYKQIASDLKRLGFLYITLDLNGFRSGSMNEVLKK